MKQTAKRLFIVGSVFWFAFWGYAGWRGYTLANDADALIAGVPPGELVPEFILEVLAAGQRYTLLAVFFGIVVPLLLLVVWWVLSPWLRSRSQPQR
jgi:hypothetical protein